MGLKPVVGEARGALLAMQADPARRGRMAGEARARLRMLLVSKSTVTDTHSGPRLVDPEALQTETIDVTVPAVTRELQRVEAQLVRRYRAWLDPNGGRLRGVLIPTGAATLRADLYDTKLDLLIEAKGATTRTHVRYAVGQLLDYRRYLIPRPAMALLLPEALPSELVDLPAEANIGAIWAVEDGFVDSSGGLLTL